MITCTCIITTKEAFKRSAFFVVYSFYFSECLTTAKTESLTVFGLVPFESESSFYFSECFEKALVFSLVSMLRWKGSVLFRLKIKGCDLGAVAKLATFQSALRDRRVCFYEEILFSQQKLKQKSFVNSF